MDGLRARGITEPERLTRGLSDKAIEGAIRWYDYRAYALGHKVIPDYLAGRLKNGGAPDFRPHPVATNWERIAAQYAPIFASMHKETKASGASYVLGLCEALKYRNRRLPSVQEVQSEYKTRQQMNAQLDSASEQKPAQLVREAQASQKKEDTTSQFVGGRDRRGT